MSVGSLCNPNVATIEPDASIQEAAIRMREAHVGDLVVTEYRGENLVPVGMITDRDLVIEILAEGVDVDALKIADVMTQRVVTVHEDNGIEFALHEMRSMGVRRLPVVGGDNTLIGILSIDDVIDHLARLSRDVAETFRAEQRKEIHSRP